MSGTTVPGQEVDASLPLLLTREQILNAPDSGGPSLNQVSEILNLSDKDLSKLSRSRPARS